MVLDDWLFLVSEWFPFLALCCQTLRPLARSLLCARHLICSVRMLSLICRPCGVSISSAAGGDSSRPMRERFDSRKTSSTDDGAEGKWTGLSGISGPWRMTLAQKSCSIGRISSGSVSFSVCILVSPPLFILDHLRNFTS